MEKRRQPEIIAGRVNSDGSIAAGDGFTVQKTGTGTYQIRFPGSFRFVASSVLKINADTPGYIQPPTEGFAVGFNYVSVVTIGGAGVDAGFSFTAVGVQQ